MPASPTQLVLITGANQGIGFQIAKILASPSEHPDHYVLLGCRDLAKGQEAANQIGGDRVEAIQIDVTDLTSIEEARRLVDTKWGRLDVLINVRLRIVQQSSTSTRAKLNVISRTQLYFAIRVYPLHTLLVRPCVTASTQTRSAWPIQSRLSCLCFKNQTIHALS